MIVSIAISIRDEQDLLSGHKRKKEGDIIAVVPYPHQWGVKERMRFLVTNIDMGEQIDWSRIRHFLTKRWTTDYLVDPRNSHLKVVLGKRRFSVRFNDLRTEFHAFTSGIDWSRVKDLGDTYQPLESLIIPYSKLKKVIYDREGQSLISDQTLTEMANLGGLL